MYTKIEEVMYIVSSIGAALSLLVSSFIIYIYTRHSEFRSFSCNLTRFLCLTDFFLSISFILPSTEGEWLCYFQAVLITYFLLASVLWTAAISHAAYTVSSDDDWDESFLTRRYVVLVYGIPLIAFFIPLVNNEYGQAEGWCWISATGVSAGILRFVCYYVPLILVITHNIIQYRRIIRELNESERQLSKRLKFYPWILIITQMTLTVHRLIFFFFGVYWAPLALIGVLSTTMMGMFNAILYGFNDTLIEHILNWCKTNENNPSVESYNMVHNSLNH